MITTFIYSLVVIYRLIKQLFSNLWSCIVSFSFLFVQPATLLFWLTHSIVFVNARRERQKIHAAGLN